MQKTELQKTLRALKTPENKRNFSQKYDLIINLRDLDLKQQDNQKDLFITLPHERGKAIRIGAIVGPELAQSAKAVADTVITTEQFPGLDKKKIRKIASTTDFFIAQANIMPEVAKVFGRVLGPRGKMPNPKAGCVVAPNANLAPLIERLKHTVKISIKTQLSIKALVGSETMPEEQTIENILAIYDAVVKVLPKETENIKNVLLKLTMSKPIKVVA